MPAGAGEGGRPLVVVPEFLPESHLELLRRQVDVIYDPDLYADGSRLLEALKGASAILIRNRTRVDEALLGACPTLRVVGRLGVGLDNIDIEAAQRAEVDIYPAHGGNAVSVAEYVVGAMLILKRGVFSMTPSMLEGNWPRQGHAFGHELNGKTLGLVGFGTIAREVATRARAFNMRVLASDPYLPADHDVWSTTGVEKVELAELLSNAHVLSIHVPGEDKTHHLIDAPSLARMRPDAVLINTSRGGIVDEEALASALSKEQIAGRLRLRAARTGSSGEIRGLGQPDPHSSHRRQRDRGGRPCRRNDGGDRARCLGL
jgi:(S)-sulfolactate dehydrogenase